MIAYSPFPAESKARVATFIDGDNIPATFRKAIAEAAGELGDPISTQLFCDLSLRPDWASETGIDVTHCKGRPGKNSADMSLCIAALDLAYRRLASAFLIASNDRDFEPLIRHLQRMGFTAIQIKTPVPPTDQPVNPASTPHATKAPPGAAAQTRSSLPDMVRAAIKAHGGSDGIAIASLNTLFHRDGFRISQQPEKTWRAWLIARPADFVCDPKGPQARVRLKT